MRVFPCHYFDSNGNIRAIMLNHLVKLPPRVFIGLNGLALSISISLSKSRINFRQAGGFLPLFLHNFCLVNSMQV